MNPDKLFISHRSRRRRPGRTGRLGAALVVAMLALLALLAPGGDGTRLPAAAQGAGGTAELQAVNGPPPLLSLHPAPVADRVAIDFRRPPRAALLFDMDTGAVLWARHARRPLPIASVTKVMTALIAAERLGPRDKVRVTRRALDVGGSKVGLLPKGRRVRAEALLYGLMLPSGNDAANVLAEGVAGTVGGFVALMNERARAMGLACTRFSSPHGLEDSGNRSCTTDLAVLARAAMDVPRVARAAGSRSAAFGGFPVKGGRIFLYNHNPLLRMRYPGATGLKTGYTDAAGRCFIGTAERGGRRLGVVLLGSPDTATQARQLLDRGFKALR